MKMCMRAYVQYSMRVDQDTESLYIVEEWLLLLIVMLVSSDLVTLRFLLCDVIIAYLTSWALYGDWLVGLKRYQKRISKQKKTYL